MKIRWTEMAALVVALILVTGPVAAQVRGTPHDLSAVAAGNECSFCHTPHGALSGTPLWNHELSRAVYKIYQSSSLDATVGQPTGASKLCLSCHDGTVAFATTVADGGGGGATIPPGAANLGTDLSDDHPVSFEYTDALSTQDVQIKPASALPEQLTLDRSSELQCTTCHDPHNNAYGNFLVMANYRSAMCLSCHDLYGWRTSAHESSAAVVIGSSDPYLQKSGYGTVADNGCLSCHRPHSASGHERLLHSYRSEDNCLNCHDGTVARTNLKADLAQISGHDVTSYEGVHDPEESPTAHPRHVECVDCHNPHSTARVDTKAPVVPGAMRGVSGVTASGGTTRQARYEYEVCFKCHGDNVRRVQSSITREITQTNTRLEFHPSNPSFHPVEAPGVNQNVPSLQPPTTVADMIYCTDCHNASSGSGAQGPHGSTYQNLLAYRYETADYTTESQFAYQLCYQCHSRNSILNDESFSKHREHLEEKVPCSACHDPHGISSSQGSILNNTHLINFDISIVRPDPLTGLRQFEDLGVAHGRCFLECHERAHSPEEY